MSYARMPVVSYGFEPERGTFTVRVRSHVVFESVDEKACSELGQNLGRALSSKSAVDVVASLSTEELRQRVGGDLLELQRRGERSVDLPASREEPAPPAREPIVWADEASPFTGAEVRVLLKENERLRAAINLDRTGLAMALERIVKAVRGWSWIPEGSNGAYSDDEPEPVWLRKEAGYLMDKVSAIALSALRDSGDVAAKALRGEGPVPPHAAVPPEVTVRGESGKGLYDITVNGIHVGDIYYSEATANLVAKAVRATVALWPPSSPPPSSEVTKEEREVIEATKSAESCVTPGPAGWRLLDAIRALCAAEEKMDGHEGRADQQGRAERRGPEGAQARDAAQASEAGATGSGERADEAGDAGLQHVASPPACAACAGGVCSMHTPPGCVYVDGVLQEKPCWTCGGKRSVRYRDANYSGLIPCPECRPGRARLDADGTATPKTKLLSHLEVRDNGKREGYVVPPADTYVADDGKRIPLTGERAKREAWLVTSTPDGCQVNEVMSNICSRGTKSCQVKHAPPILPNPPSAADDGTKIPLTTARVTLNTGFEVRQTQLGTDQGAYFAVIAGGETIVGGLYRRDAEEKLRAIARHADSVRVAVLKDSADECEREAAHALRNHTGDEAKHGAAALKHMARRLRALASRVTEMSK